MALSALRILVVDDYEPLRYLKTIMLRRGGATVVEAKSGREALQILGVVPIDMAVLDINLPDMSAIELGEAMRADAETALIPVIYTSASERPTGLAPDAAFFQEPIDRGELTRTILRLTER
jgi:CheY-like chemotaxis protein